MKILVTGSQGYIGTQLMEVLAKRGHEAHGLDNGYYQDGLLYESSDEADDSFIRKDIRRVTAADVEGYDAVAHLAELSNDPLGQHNKENTYAINHQGSLRLARCCKEAGVERFVYTSSCSVYGVPNGEGLKTETSAPRPQTAYAECKVLVERDVSAMADESFSPTFLRNATAYGPSPRMRFDIVLNNLAGHAWTNHEIRMTSDGTPWRPLVHVLDICEAIACALEAPRETVHGEIFNVGATEENYQIRAVAETVATTFPDCRLTVGQSDGDDRSYRVSFDKIHEQLPGFACQYTVQDGAQQLLRVFERIGMSKDDFSFRAFTRLKQLEHLITTKQIDDQFFWRNEAP